MIDLQELPNAWKAGGTSACAKLLGTPSILAGSIISNMRRNNPQNVPRRAREGQKLTKPGRYGKRFAS